MVEPVKKNQKPAHGKQVWHKLEAMFSREDGLEPAAVDGIPVLIPGMLSDVPVIQIPASATPETYDRISKALVEAGCPEPFIISSNVLMFQFREITSHEATRIMDETKAKLEAIGAERARLQKIQEGIDPDGDVGADGGDDADGDGGDGDGSQPDGVGAGDAGAGDADVAGGDAGEDTPEPGIVEEQEA